MLGRVDPRNIFTDTIFTRRVPVAPSAFIKAMHPKTEILPSSEAIARILQNGWMGQLKIHGHRAQIHIPSESTESLIAYTRQGKRHSLGLSPSMIEELCRVLRPKQGWNVVDAEWLKGEEKLFLFDFLKKEGEVLSKKTFPERWALLPRAFISPHLKVLPLIRDLASCMKVLESDQPDSEGLVFKSGTSIGFSDTSIVRCRKRK